MKRITTPQELENIREEIVSGRDPERPCIAITSGTSARAYGSEKVIATLRAELKRQGVAENVDIRITGGQGFDEREPLLIVYPQDILYQQVKPKDRDKYRAEKVFIVSPL